MHLDVCLIVEICVLIGLDWVKSMMQFLLARHMFMYFSCIHTLSLSLSNRLRRALKRKSTLVRNPLRSRSSSSSNLPFFHVQFCDEKAHQDFLKNFSKRGIHPEHHVILLDFADTTLLDVFILGDGNLSVRYP